MSLTEKDKIEPSMGRIISINRELGYANAFNLLRDRGRFLPSNLLLDRILARPVYQNRTEWKKLAGYYYTLWVRELLVYPEPDGVFERGKDVMDSYKDLSGRVWLFPVSSIPQEALDMKGVGLFVYPKCIKADSGRVIVEADHKEVIVLKNFLQKNGWGKVDEETRVPVGLSSEREVSYSERYLRRTEGVGIRPIVRGLDNDKRLVINASETQDMKAGVGFVEHEDHGTKEEEAIGIMERLRRFFTVRILNL